VVNDATHVNRRPINIERKVRHNISGSSLLETFTTTSSYGDSSPLVERLINGPIFE
jgi:hypothetical protein